MNKLLLFTAVIVGLVICNAQVPDIEIKTTEGKIVKLSEISNHDGPILICFWATWCKPCLSELDNIAEIYEDWQAKTKVKIIAISIDDSRSTSKAATVARTRGWPYNVLLDPNNDAMRSFNVIDIPHSFLYDKEKKLVWQHNGYLPGDEDSLFQQLIKISKL